MLDYAVTAALLFGVLTLWWWLSVRLKDTSIIDIAWGPGFVLCAYAFWVQAGLPLDLRALVLLAVVSIWGLRLGGYIAWRNHGKGEDYRYRAMREKVGGAWWWQSLFTVFYLQGALILLIAAPLFVGLQAGGGGLGLLNSAGLLLWGIGFFFEAVGDWQMARFKANPDNRGRVMDQGVWRYTRHPNYFGDAAQWWGFWLLALGSPGAWWTVYAPLLMTFLLLRVSGVALLEKGLSSSKPGYAEYVARTSPFIPWFPRRPETRPEPGAGEAGGD